MLVDESVLVPVQVPACMKQGVALTRHNTTGPPLSVSRPPTRPAAAHPPSVLQTTTDNDDSEQNNTGSLGGPVTRCPE